MDAQEIELESNIVSKFEHIDAKIKIKNSSIGFVVDFCVHVVADAICARCLEIFVKEFESSIRLIYVKGEDPLMEIERVKLKSIDVDRVHYTGSQLDMSIGIREAILLALPIAPICKSSCQGLCPICGRNRNKYSCKCVTEKGGLFTPKLSVKNVKKKASQKK